MADLCSVCGKSGPDGVLRRGMCAKHYERWRIHGDPTVVLVAMPDDRGTPQHGTRSMHAGGCRCDPCRTANADYLRAWRAANRDKTRAARKRWLAANKRTARLSAWATEQRRRDLPPTAATVAYAGVLLGDPCSYCGSLGGVIDHIVAQDRGGDGCWRNLTATCGSCNSQKHSKPLLHFLLGRVS